MYVPIKTAVRQDNNISSLSSTQSRNQLTLLKLHYSLGHPSKEYMKRMMRMGFLEDVIPRDLKTNEMEIVSRCPVCPLAKGHRLPFSSTRPRADTFLENVHVDLSGIIRTTAVNKEEYYVMFTDDYSSYRVTYGLPDKTSETVFNCFVKFIAYSERQTGKKVKMFSLDGGGEFINSLLTPYLEELGIVKRVTAPYTAEQNGVSERANRTINTKARCMMVQSGAPI